MYVINVVPFSLSGVVLSIGPVVQTIVLIFAGAITFKIGEWKTVGIAILLSSAQMAMVNRKYESS